jgi:hypothetical protein
MKLFMFAIDYLNERKYNKSLFLKRDQILQELQFLKIFT